MGLRFYCFSTTLYYLQYFHACPSFFFCDHLRLLVAPYNFYSAANRLFSAKCINEYQFRNNKNWVWFNSQLNLSSMLQLFLLTFNFNLLMCSESMCRLPGYKTTVLFLLLCCRGATPHRASHFSITQTSYKPHVKRLFEA